MENRKVEGGGKTKDFSDSKKTTEEQGVLKIGTPSWEGKCRGTRERGSGGGLVEKKRQDQSGGHRGKS